MEKPRNKKPRMGLFRKICCLCAGLGLLSGIVRAEEVKPNILLVMVDDLASDADHPCHSDTGVGIYPPPIRVREGGQC